MNARPCARRPRHAWTPLRLVVAVASAVVVPVTDKDILEQRREVVRWFARRGFVHKEAARLAFFRWRVEQAGGPEAMRRRGRE